VKNITVSVPDDVYRDARVRAAEQGRSVSALVAEYLASLSDQGRELARLGEKRRRIIAEMTHFSAADRLDRDAVHERGVR
jgi:plasmid stability protein